MWWSDTVNGVTPKVISAAQSLAPLGLRLLYYRVKYQQYHDVYLSDANFLKAQ